MITNIDIFKIIIFKFNFISRLKSNQQLKKGKIKNKNERSGER